MSHREPRRYELKEVVLRLEEGRNLYSDRAISNSDAAVEVRWKETTAYLNVQDLSGNKAIYSVAFERDLSGNNQLEGIYADGVLLSDRGRDAALRIPERLDDMRIRTIGDGAFMESAELRQVIVPNGVKSIGVNSFYGCKRLTSAHIPSSVSSFADGAFGGCPELADLYLYGVELSERQYKELIASSVRVSGAAFLSCAFPRIRSAGAAVGSTSVKPANRIRHGVSWLFTSRDPDGRSAECDHQNRSEKSGFLRVTRCGGADRSKINRVGKFSL